MTSRRAFLAAAVAASLMSTTPAAMAALDDLLGGLTDAITRRYAEKHRDEARWDGKYYYDNYDNRRYTKKEWEKELSRRARAEHEGRDWRDAKRRSWEEKKYGKNYRTFKKADAKKPEPKKPEPKKPEPKKVKKPDPKKDRKPDPKRDPRRDPRRD